MGIFRKIVGAHSLPKFFENFLTPTKKGFNPDFCMPLCLVSESFRLVCFLALLAECLRGKITFQSFGGRF